MSIGVIYSSRTISLPSLKLLGKSILELPVAQGEEDWHDLWPTDLNINRGHLLIKDYLPTKFEASGAKSSWVISCSRWSRLAWPLTLTFDLLTPISIGVIYSSCIKYCAAELLVDCEYREITLKFSRAQGKKCDTIVNILNWRDKVINIDVCKTLMPPFPNI